MRSVVLALLASLSLVAAVVPPYTHHAIFDNIQAATNSTAWGAAVGSFDRNTGIFTYTIVNNVINTTVAHIHGPNGTVGNFVGVLVPIPGFDTGSNPVASGSVTIPAANYDDIDNGATYFNIHTRMWPNGEIRGQILAIGQQITTLDASQETNVISNATGVAWTKFDSSSNSLTLILTHNVQNATLAHIHGPAAVGVQAPPIITIAGDPFAAAAQPYSMTVMLTSEQVNWLNEGLLYYNVHSSQYQGGEIRGQITPIINYLAELNGDQDQQVTSEKGVGIAALYGSALWSAIYHTVPNPIMAHIHTGAPNVSGPITFNYTDWTVVPIEQNFTAVGDQITALQNGTDYFNVHTEEALAGLIRGQIYAKQQTPGTPSTSTSSSPTSSSGTTTSAPAATTSSSSSSSVLFSSISLVLAAVALLA